MGSKDSGSSDKESGNDVGKEAGKDVGNVFGKDVEVDHGSNDNEEKDKVSWAWSAANGTSKKETNVVDSVNSDDETHGNDTEDNQNGKSGNAWNWNASSD